MKRNSQLPIKCIKSEEILKCASSERIEYLNLLLHLPHSELFIDKRQNQLVDTELLFKIYLLNGLFISKTMKLQ